MIQVIFLSNNFHPKCIYAVQQNALISNSPIILQSDHLSHTYKDNVRWAQSNKKTKWFCGCQQWENIGTINWYHYLHITQEVDNIWCSYCVISHGIKRQSEHKTEDGQLQSMLRHQSIMSIPFTPCKSQIQIFNSSYSPEFPNNQTFHKTFSKKSRIRNVTFHLSILLQVHHKL